MSNVNIIINKFRKIYFSSRGRNFSCISNLNELQLKDVLCKHDKHICCYSYAFHDMDTREDGTLIEPHFHIFLVTYNFCTISSIYRWFSDFDDNDCNIITTVQKCSDVFEMCNYLTHSTFHAQANGKYQYDKNIVVTK